ncbi:Unknown protein, partial [Striga hermonthica]
VQESRRKIFLLHLGAQLVKAKVPKLHQIQIPQPWQPRTFNLLLNPQPGFLQFLKNPQQRRFVKLKLLNPVKKEEKVLPLSLNLQRSARRSLQKSKKAKNVVHVPEPAAGTPSLTKSVGESSPNSDADFVEKEIANYVAEPEKSYSKHAADEELSPPEKGKDVDEVEGDGLDSPLTVGNAFSRQFYSPFAETRFSTIFSQMKFCPERTIVSEHYEQLGLLELLKKVGLEDSVTSVGKYCPLLVGEFYSNLTTSVSYSSSMKFQKVFVRNGVIDFSPSVVNSILGLAEGSSLGPLTDDLDEVDLTLIGGQLTICLAPGIFVKSLTPPTNALQKIGASNWTPTTHKQFVTPTQDRVIYRVLN